MFAVSVDSRTATTPPLEASLTDEPLVEAVVVATTSTLVDPMATDDATPHHDSPNWSAAQDYDKVLHKILNGIILTLAFGSAIYAVVNIDAGMTRGWTQSVSTGGGATKVYTL
jgi:hypothetical protein